MPGYGTSLVSSSQLLCPFPTPRPPKAHSLQEAAAERGKKEKGLAMDNCCLATAKPTAVNPEQHQMGSREES